MSQPESIATVTKVIRDVMSRDSVGNTDITVSARTPDRAAAESGRRINLFLFHATPNLSWRNQAMPRSPGAHTGRARAPLALNLHYLITAYEDDNNEYAGQELLGKVMSRLHDFPVISSKELAPYRESELDQQVDHVRIIPDPLSIEEMTRLWSTFQTQYRVSAAYQASVVLIESKRTTVTPLPVARRGKFDRGVYLVPGPGPVLSSIEYRGGKTQPTLPAATVGQTISIIGSNLIGSQMRVVVRDPKQNRKAKSELEKFVAKLNPVIETPGERLTIELDSTEFEWPSGQLDLTIEIDRVVAEDPKTGEKEVKTSVSNRLPLLVAPKPQAIVGQRIVSFQEEDNGKKLLTVSLVNRIGVDRKVYLLLDRETEKDEKPSALAPIPMVAKEDGLPNINPQFNVKDVPPGTYWARIRVEGVDSMLMVRKPVEETGGFEVLFDETQKVVIR